MAHILTRDQHREVHSQHIDRVGMHSSYQFYMLQEAPNSDTPLEDLRDTPSGRIRIEVCTQCGFIEHVVCEHMTNRWSHRPGCLKYDQNELGFEPWYTPYDQAFPDSLSEDDCAGCLLICVMCGGDGT